MMTAESKPVHRATRIGRAGARLLGVGLGLGLSLSACTASSRDPNAPASSVTPDALMRVADTTRQSGNLGDAANLYARAAEMDPKNVKPLLELGSIYGQMRSPKPAAAAWKAALALDPKNPIALRGLGNAELELGDPASAITNVKASQAIQPDWRNDNSLGVAYDMQGDHAAAQAAYKDGLALSPGNLQ